MFSIPISSYVLLIPIVFYAYLFHFEFAFSLTGLILFSISRLPFHPETGSGQALSRLVFFTVEGFVLRKPQVELFPNEALVHPSEQTR